MKASQLGCFDRSVIISQMEAFPKSSRSICTRNYGLMLPSSSGGPAIAAGYGVNVKAMFKWGTVLTALVLVTLVAGGYVLATFWPGFGVA